jgi:hypothetical protein
MNVVLAFLVGFGIAYFLQGRRIRRLKSTVDLLKEQIEAQRQAFESMMFDLNHRGEISPAASLVGLINVITHRMTHSLLKPLKERYARQNWYTLDLITELTWIIESDMNIKLAAAERWLEQNRAWLKRYHRFQATPGTKEYETG